MACLGGDFHSVIGVLPIVILSRILGMGTANGWFLRLSTRIHVDQIIICLSQNSPKLERLEVQWDPDTIRYSDNSSKFIDQLRSVTASGTFFRKTKLGCQQIGEG